jgi:hypothetical protein
LLDSTSVNQIVLQLADNARMVTAYAANQAVAPAAPPIAFSIQQQRADG